MLANEMHKKKFSPPGYRKDQRTFILTKWSVVHQ